MRGIAKRCISAALAVVLMLSLVCTGGLGSMVASAATGSNLANVTESYVDAANGKKIINDTSYSETHEQKSPKAITGYQYVDYTESVERVYSHKDLTYIYGYPDRTVRTDRNMTRGEAAAVFYRLYDRIYPNMQYRMSTTTFKDLPKNAWYYNEVETLYNIGVVQDDDRSGRFRGDEAITRAEFATWAARWANLAYATGRKFSDVNVGYWAYGDINAASAAGWIDGYPDGTFRPDNFIQRAEVMKLVNGMVNRSITVNELNRLGVRNPYTDLSPSHWAYAQVMEATVQHLGSDWHGTNYNNSKFNQIIEKFVDGEGKEISSQIVSDGKAENASREIGGYEYVGYIRHITYVYNKGNAAPVVTKTANVKESYVGGEIEYTVSLGNKSDAKSAWKNVVMTDQLPTGVSLVEGSIYVDKQLRNYALNGNTLTVNVGDIEAGKTVTVSFRVKVQAGMEGKTILNTVVAKGENGTAKDDTYTATDTGVLINQGVIKPSVVKTASTKTAHVGDRVTYTINASNDTSATYKIVDGVVRDTIPEGVTLRDGSVMLNGTTTAYSYNDQTRVLSVKVGDIAPGASASVTFAVDVNRDAYGKTIYNEAILGGGNIADVSDKDDGVLIDDGETVPTLTKTSSAKTAHVGDKITYTLVAGNDRTATVALKNATVTDTLPQGLEFVYGSVQVGRKATNDVYYNAETRTLAVRAGDIAVGKTVEVTFAAEVTKDAYGKNLINTAVLSGDNGNDVTAKDPGVNVGAGMTDPSLTKQVDKTTAKVGERITYTMTASNAYTASTAITKPVITDTLPQGLEFVYGSVQVNNMSVSASYNEATRVLNIPLNDLSAGSSVKATFVAEVTNAAYGKVIKNVAVLTGENSSEVKAEAPGVNVGDGKAKPYIEKTSNKRTATEGDRIEYTMKVGNGETATVAVADPVVTDVIPAGLDFIDGSVYVDGRSYSNVNYDSNTRLLTICLDNIDPDSYKTVKFSARVNADAYGTTIENLGTLTSSNGEIQQDKDDGVTVPDGKAKLEISKVADNTTYKVGERVNYTVTVGAAYNSDVAARNVEITDEIPDGLTFGGIVQVDGYSATYSYNAKNQTLTIPLCDITPGASRTITMEFVVNADAYGKTIKNVALASADNAPDNSATDKGINIPAGKPDGYTASKTVSKTTAKVGDTLTYTFRLHNGAGATASWDNATITDTLPDGVTYAGNVQMNGMATYNYSWDAASKTIKMVAPSIAAGESVTFTFDVTVDADSQGKYIVNTAVVDGPGSEPDMDISDPGVNVDPGDPSPWSSKTVDKSTASVGEVITYTVQVGNGRSATAPWKNIVMSDTLPAGVQVVGGVSADGEPLAFTTDGGVLTAKIGNLGIGESMTIKYQVLVLPEAAGTTLRNSVVFTGKDGNNSSSTTTTTVPKDNTNRPDGVNPGGVTVTKDVSKTLVNLSGNTEDKRVEYTVTAKNESTSDTWEDVILTDVLDYTYVTLLNDTVYVDNSRLSSNQFVFQNQTLRIELGDIAPGKQKVVRFSVEFRENAGGKNYENHAYASGTMDGKEKTGKGDAPIVQVSSGSDVSGIHYAIFHGSNDGNWLPSRELFTEELATTAYRILTNDYQMALQKKNTTTIPSFMSKFSTESQYMVGAGVISADAFDLSKMTKDVDYVYIGGPVGGEKYGVYASRDQIGQVLKNLFGSDYGIRGSGRMTRLEYAKLLCSIQGRDTNPNWLNAYRQGLSIDRFPDDNNNATIIEVSNTHDYTTDSHGNETWVLNNSLK